VATHWLREAHVADELAGRITSALGRRAEAVHVDTDDFVGWVVEVDRRAGDDRPPQVVTQASLPAWEEVRVDDGRDGFVVASFAELAAVADYPAGRVWPAASALVVRRVAAPDGGRDWEVLRGVELVDQGVIVEAEGALLARSALTGRVFRRGWDDDPLPKVALAYDAIGLDGDDPHVAYRLRSRVALLAAKAGEAVTGGRFDDARTLIAEAVVLDPTGTLRREAPPPSV
jgi:hypothetical protein